MAEQILEDFETLQKKATLVEAPRLIGELRRTRTPAGPPKGAIVTFIGALGVLLLALSAPAMGTSEMPLIFIICAISFGGFFGMGMILTPIFKELEGNRRGDMVQTGAGTLTRKEAAMMILPLPIALAAFGIFTIVAKAVIFA